MNKREMIRLRIEQAVGIANTDPEGQKLARKLANGKLLVKVGEELRIPIKIENGTLTIVDDPSHPRAICAFSDAEAAWALLTNSLSPYFATVHRKLDQMGLSTMNETFEKIWLLAHERLDEKD